MYLHYTACNSVKPSHLVSISVKLQKKLYIRKSTNSIPKFTIFNTKKCHPQKTNLPLEAEQWLINLIELKNKTGITVKQIAEMENVAEKSVSNVFSNKSKSPSVNLIRRIIHALGGSWREIFGESDAVIGNQDFATLQSEVDRLTEENINLTNSLNIATLELNVLKEKLTALENENKLLCLKLEYEEKLNAVHSFYNKLNPNG